MSEQQNGDWYCRQCGYLHGSRVTYSETCDTCHQPVEFHTVAEMSEIESLRQQLAEVQPSALKEKLRCADERIAELEQQLAEARAGRVPEGWRVEAVEAEGRKGFIVGAPRVNGVRHNTSVWPDDDDPAHRLLYMLLSKQPPAGGAGLDAKAAINTLDDLFWLAHPRITSGDHQRFREVIAYVATALAAQPQQEVGQ